MRNPEPETIRRYLLAVTALAFALFMAWGCASVHESMKGKQLITSAEFYTLWPDTTETAR